MAEPLIESEPIPSLPLTEAQNAALDGTRCPYCYSSALEALDPFGLSANQGFQAIRCQDCSQRWTDIWKIVRFEPVSDDLTA